MHLTSISSKFDKNILSSSAEYVGKGHPDKIADQIADAILNEAIYEGKKSQISCEVLISKKLIVVAGEFYTIKPIPFKLIVCSVLKQLNYSPDEFEIIIYHQKQSSNIRDVVLDEKSQNVFSGDQSIVFGYATNETPEYLPLSHVIARDLIKTAEKLIDNKTFWWAKYDMKSLVTLHKNTITQQNYINTLIFSIQHVENITQEEIKNEIDKHLIKPLLINKYKLSDNIPNKFINTSKKFVIGGVDSDSGATNRKLMIDTYGTDCKHGGGGLNGKDFSKIDRLGAYYARWICKNLVAAQICPWIELKLCYFLGGEKPVEFALSQDVNAQYSSEKIINCIQEIFPYTVNEIIDLFLPPTINLSDVAVNGHFGRMDLDLPWEELNKVKIIEEWFQKN